MFFIFIKDLNEEEIMGTNSQKATILQLLTHKYNRFIYRYIGIDTCNGARDRLYHESFRKEQPYAHK